MKTKTTAKALRASGGKTISASYCALQHLLRNHEPIAYTCGTYGWNFDVYSVYGLTICTGYRGMVGKRATDCELFDTRARRVWEDYDLTSEEQAEQIEELLREFCRLNGADC